MSRSVNRLGWGSPGIDSGTFAEMIAIVTPTNGLQFFVNDPTVSTYFTFNSTFGRFTAPEYIILTNEDTTTAITGDIMEVSSTTDFNVLLATTANEIDIAGVCVIGGIQDATILVKYAGEVDVNVVNAAVRTNKIAVDGVTAGKGVGTIGALPGVFGIAIADKVGSQIRILIAPIERF